MLDAAGFDVVLLETVGVGQAEIDVASMADTTVVLLAPGMGDGIQAAKAGILEIADVFVVNKADRPGADQTARDLRSMQLPVTGDDAWTVPIVKTSAGRGEGLAELWDAVTAHRHWMERTGVLADRRAARAAVEIEAIALARLRARFGDVRGSAALRAAAGRVAQGTTDPYTAAGALIDSVFPAGSSGVEALSRVRSGSGAARRLGVTGSCRRCLGRDTGIVARGLLDLQQRRLVLGRLVGLAAATDPEQPLAHAAGTRQRRCSR